MPLEGAELREWRQKQQEEKARKLLEEQQKVRTHQQRAGGRKGRGDLLMPRITQTPVQEEEKRKNEAEEIDEEEDDVSLLFHTTAHSFNPFKENCDWYYLPYDTTRHDTRVVNVCTALWRWQVCAQE